MIGRNDVPSVVTPDFTERQLMTPNAPPIGTSLPSDYTRGLSVMSLECEDNSPPNTPVHLFTAMSYN